MGSSLVWLYLAHLIILFGAELTHAMGLEERRSRGLPATGPSPSE